MLGASQGRSGCCGGEKITSVCLESNHHLLGAHPAHIVCQKVCISRKTCISFNIFNLPLWMCPLPFQAILIAMISVCPRRFLLDFRIYCMSLWCQPECIHYRSAAVVHWRVSASVKVSVTVRTSVSIVVLLAGYVSYLEESFEVVSIIEELE